MTDILDGPLGGPVAKYHLTDRQGKAVQEVLNRYLNEELRSQLSVAIDAELDTDGLEKDIDYITGLAKLFD